jgi:ATP/maltotriose-dependent transcriptional regulator MalT
VPAAFQSRRLRGGMEFLGEDVLARQPEEVQAFLLRTSIVERLCAPLCDALLAERLSNKEIAQTLLISPLTVKTHAGSIYSKLGVAGRREAIRKARVLGLLPSS